MSHPFTLGIDVSKASLDISLSGEKETRFIQVSNNEKGFEQLTQWLVAKQIGSLHCCLEATGRYGEAVSLHLYKAGYDVSIVNPKAVKYYAKAKMQRNKTDQLDAKLLAEYCRKETPYLWHPPAEATQILQAMTRRLGNLKDDRVREVNRLKAGSHPVLVRQSLESTITYFTAQIDQLGEAIDHHIKANPTLREKNQLLETIPGVGVTTAAVILSELPLDDRIMTSKQATAFAGLVPQQAQSGQVHRRKGLCKQGSSRLRKALYMAALSAKRHNPRFRPFVARMEKEGKHTMKIIGAVMRKLLVLAYGILKSGKPFDPVHGMPQPSPLTIVK